MSRIDDAFDDAYERLSEFGHCDSPGGMEYTRVLEEYEAAGKPADVEAFIRDRAHVGPSGPWPPTGATKGKMPWPVQTYMATVPEFITYTVDLKARTSTREVVRRHIAEKPRYSICPDFCNEDGSQNWHGDYLGGFWYTNDEDGHPSVPVPGEVVRRMYAMLECHEEVRTGARSDLRELWFLALVGADDGMYAQYCQSRGRELERARLELESIPGEDS